jgi:hypothetical protein
MAIEVKYTDRKLIAETKKNGKKIKLDPIVRTSVESNELLELKQPVRMLYGLVRVNFERFRVTDRTVFSLRVRH